MSPIMHLLIIITVTTSHHITRDKISHYHLFPQFPSTQLSIVPTFVYIHILYTCNIHIVYIYIHINEQMCVYIPHLTYTYVLYMRYYIQQTILLGRTRKEYNQSIDANDMLATIALIVTARSSSSYSSKSNQE